MYFSIPLFSSGWHNYLLLPAYLLLHLAHILRQPFLSQPRYDAQHFFGPCDLLLFYIRCVAHLYVVPLFRVLGCLLKAEDANSLDLVCGTSE